MTRHTAPTVSAGERAVGAAPVHLPPAWLDGLRAAWPAPSGPYALRDPTQPPPRLWRLDLTHPLEPLQLATLDATEQQRAARFKFERDRQRYRSAHAAVRALLAEAGAVDPARLQFTTGPHGKPAPVGLQFAHNLSHSDAVGLLVVGAAGIGWGVDVECLREVHDALDVARRVFTPGEFAAWSRVPPSESMRAFLQLWTRKEACLKAIGSGFSVEPDRFEAGFSEGPGGLARPAWRTVALPTPQGPITEVLLADLDAGAGVVAALALWPQADLAVWPQAALSPDPGC